MQGKKAAREALRHRLGLTGWGDKPLVGVVTRLTEQKGAPSFPECICLVTECMHMKRPSASPAILHCGTFVLTVFVSSLLKLLHSLVT